MDMDKKFQQTSDKSPTRKRTMTIVSKEKERKLTMMGTDESIFVPSDIPTAKFNELSKRKESTYVRHTLNEANNNNILVATKE